MKSTEDQIDIDALEAKRQRVKVKSANPANSEYGDKLAKLLDSKATARDGFVNWITGLASGAMFLAFSNVSSAPTHLQIILLLSGFIFFLCIISALACKILLEVRFCALELEVSLLKNIWEGHDIRTQLQELMQRGVEITEENKQKFLRNMDESLNYPDESNLEKLKKPINIKSRLLVYAYWLTLGLFITGLGIMVFYFVRLVCK